VTTYLIDADVLIQSKNTFYAFPLCPGFWDFLDSEIPNGELRSVRQVRLELEAGTDQLAAWAKARAGTFFVEPTAATATAMTQVSNWVQAGPFTEPAKRDFLARADAFLIAHALELGGTVVTFEQPNQPGQTGKVKIPTVCAGLGVPFERPFAVLQRRGAVFTL
jgi:Domain of unknown function (DUF4411)